MTRRLGPEQQALLARAAACFDAGAYAEVLLLVDAVLAQALRTVDALFLKAEASRHTGQLDEALRCCRRLTEAGVRSAPLFVAKGLTHRARGEAQDALRCFERAARLAPDSAEALGNLAKSLADTGALDQACAHAMRALALAPQSAALRGNLGALQLRARDYEAAWRCLIEAAPPGFIAPRALLLALAAQLAEAEAHARAMALCRALLARDAHDAEACNGLGQSQYMLGDYAAAEASFAALVAHDPDDPRGHYGLGALHRLAGRHAEARAALAQTLALLHARAAPRTEVQRVQVELGFAALAGGDLAAGWNHYAGRWYAHEPDPEQALAPRLWQGEPLAGRRLVVIREQGVGDEILFASMYGELPALGPRLVVQCSTRLVDVFRRSFPGVEWWPCPERPESWQSAAARLADDDVVVFAGSLPRHLRTTRAAFGSGEPYLQPDPDARDAWRRRFASRGQGPAIGLSWRGGTAPNFRGLRSMALATMLEGLRDALPPDSVLVNLQYDDCEAEIAACERDFGLRLWREDVTRTDFAATIDLVAALDQVITVQTAVAHVGGALGVPTRVLVPHAPTTVRWLPAAGRSAWYRSVRLFEQSTVGEWTSALAAVAHTLRTETRPT